MFPLFDSSYRHVNLGRACNSIDLDIERKLEHMTMFSQYLSGKC